MNCTVEIFEKLNTKLNSGKKFIYSQNFIWKKSPPRAYPRVDFPLCYEIKDNKNNNDQKYHFYVIENYEDVAKVNCNREYTIYIKNKYSSNTDDIYNYFVTVDIIEINRNYDTILKKIKTFSEPNQLKLLMKKKEDEDKFSVYEKISFYCQYTGKRIKIPCRGYDCLHLQVIYYINLLVYYRYRCLILETIYKFKVLKIKVRKHGNVLYAKGRLLKYILMVL